MSKKIKVKNNLTYVSTPRGRETVNDPSMTVPDEAYSIRTILTRFQNGLPDFVSVRSPFETDQQDDDFDDDDLSAVSRMDPAERLELAELRKLEAKEAQEEIERQKVSRKYEKPKGKAKEASADKPTTQLEDVGAQQTQDDPEEGVQNESAS